MSKNLLLFEEKYGNVSFDRILAQKFIDNGAHPSNFVKNDKLKNQISTEYNRRKLLEIVELMKSLSSNKIKRIKHYLNFRSRNNILNVIKEYNYTKLDNLYNFILQLSKHPKITIPKSKTEKIKLKIGPNKGTRRKKRGKRQLK